MIVRIKKEMVSKVVFRRDGKVLILERSVEPSPRSPWEWDLPGGHMEEGETFYQAALREVREETKLAPVALKLIGKDSNAGKKTCFYVCDSWDGDIQLSNEHKSYKWISEDELPIYKDSIGKMYHNIILKAFKM
jgi:8-oxo-dGTP pyrophosphatase MutT (NUDIX family)